MTKTKVGIRRVFADIETSHNVVLAFRSGYDLTINPEDIISERKVICIAWKFEGEKTKLLFWDKNQDDKEMLRKFVEIVNEADELVAHSGDKFDWPFVRTRCLVNGLEPIPQWKTIDTCAWARKHYLFNSNKLDYISKVLGFSGKIKTDRQMWHDILLRKCPKALAKMGRYNIGDVERLAEVYYKLAKCLKPKTHVGVLNGGEKWQCPFCGSANVEFHKKRITANGSVQFDMRCCDCGSYFTISKTSFNQYLDEKKRIPALRIAPAKRNRRR